MKATTVEAAPVEAAPAAPHPRRRELRAVATGLTAVLCVAWFLVLRPQSLGGPALFIRVSGISMQPTFWDGDLLVVQRARAYRRGEIVAYPVPSDAPHGVRPGTLIIHRIVSGTGASGWTTQGDNRDEADPWRPADAEVSGRVWLHIPNVAGWIRTFVSSPVLVSVLLASIVFAFAVTEPRRKKDV